MKRITLALAVLCILVIGCKDAPLELTPAPSSGQRVAHLAILYYRFLDQEPMLDTVLIDGMVKAIASKDSMSFRYDSQGRLTNYDRTQYSANVGGPYTSGTLKSEYTYQNGQLQELEGSTGIRFQYRLDDSQRRVLSRTKKRYSYIDVDTLRQYSAEGILKTVQLLNNRQVFTIDNGNVVRIEQYGIASGKLEQVTQMTYDNTHLAPPAQLTFLGETSRNALVHKKILDYGYADGVHIYDYTYTNEFDAQGRMTRQIEYHQESWYNQGKPYFWTATDYYY
jgi:hypothetical protein